MRYVWAVVSTVAMFLTCGGQMWIRCSVVISFKNICTLLSFVVEGSFNINYGIAVMDNIFHGTDIFLYVYKKFVQEKLASMDYS